MHRNPRIAIYRALTVGIIFVTCATLGVSVSLAQTMAPAAAKAKKQLTLDRLFSAPYLGGETTEGIEWTPDSKRFSYLKRDSGSGTLDDGSRDGRAQSSGERGNI